MMKRFHSSDCGLMCGNGLQWAHVWEARKYKMLGPDAGAHGSPHSLPHTSGEPTCHQEKMDQECGIRMSESVVLSRRTSLRR